MEHRFRARLEQEFNARRDKNPRYSLRAFAAFLATDHSTLSQILRGQRRPPARQVRSWARKLGLDAEEAVAYIAAEHLTDESSFRRENQLRHWTAEALGVVMDRIHWNILRLCGTPGFRPDTRWIAEQTGTTVDQVNVAISRLLRLQLLEMNTTGAWTDLTPAAAKSEREFRKLALTRIREKAAEQDVKLPPARKRI